MKLYRLGKLRKVYPPDQLADVVEEQKILREEIGMKDEQDIPEHVHEKWLRLNDLMEAVMGVTFFDNLSAVMRRARLTRGETAEISILALPDDDHTALFRYLDPVDATTHSPVYRVPMPDLWEHLGVERDWSLRFSVIRRPFEGDEPEILTVTRLTVRDGYIELYHPGSISRFFGQAEAKDMRTQLERMEKLRLKYPSDQAMQRRDRGAYEQLVSLRATGRGLSVYLSEEEARNFSAGADGFTVIRIPSSFQQSITEILEAQGGKGRMALPWEVVWDHCVNNKDWLHEYKRNEGEQTGEHVQDEARKTKPR
ncbi:hypothetical protein HY732_03385 [Candidatus Uhrbacteria bacterium]|nr:hypothetical protein [Candidatus Uhrbacteria bacterium]